MFRSYFALPVHIVLTHLAVMAFVGQARAAGTAEAVAALDEMQSRLSNHYIVILNPNVEQSSVADASIPATATAVSRRYGGIVTHTYQYALKGFALEIGARDLERLRSDERVAYVEQDAPVTASATQLGAPWGLDRIDQRGLPLNGAFDYLDRAGAAAHAYIIDSGIFAAHPDFAGRVVPGVDFVDNDADPDDCNGHGTHVAGVVGSATYGVAKRVTLHSIRVLDCNGIGSTSMLLNAIDYVTNNHISPAVAGIWLGRAYSRILNDAVAKSVAAGVTYIAAAGNSASSACDFSPASTATAITVGATNGLDVKWPNSNFGRCLDLFAPGVDVSSTGLGGTTSVRTGTSAAAAHVAGLAALYLGAHPTASPAEVASALTANATVGSVQDAGTGSPNLLLYSGFLSNGAAPCDGLCSGATNISIQGSYQSGAVGEGATCYAARSAVSGGNCGNFVSPRTLSVNGQSMPCNGLNWTSIPAVRNGGYCVQTTPGNYAWAFFTLW